MRLYQICRGGSSTDSCRGPSEPSTGTEIREQVRPKLGAGAMPGNELRASRPSWDRTVRRTARPSSSHSLPLRTRAADGASSSILRPPNSSALIARTRQRQISQGFLNQHILVLGVTQSEIPLARIAASDKLQPSEPRYGRDQRIRTIGVLA